MYQPVVPFGGNAGWAFLERTRETQQAAFDNSTLIKNNTAYFEENIGEVLTAEQLVNDRRLLDVALGAFGLSEDINNRFFIQKVLESDLTDEDSLANRLADKRYEKMAEAFAFALSPPSTQISTFPEEITSAYKTRSFEVAVGNQNSDMRLALGLERDLNDVLSSDLSEDGYWFSIMGNNALRAVFEQAFDLPLAVGALDIDRQLEIFKDRATAFFGSDSIQQFADPENQEELQRLFFARSDTSAASFTGTTLRGSVALAILQS